MSIIRSIKPKSPLKSPKRHKKNQQSREVRLNKSWTALAGIAIIFLGVILIIASYALPSFLATTHPNASELISSTLMTVGQVVISIAATAMLFEHFGYADYAVHRMCEVLTKDEALDVLTEERKRELKGKLSTNIHLAGEQSEAPLRLLNQLDADTDTILKDYYYEEHITFCDISIAETQNGKKYFHKHIHRCFTVKPIRTGEECHIKRLYYVKISKLPDGTKDLKGNSINATQISRLSIQNKELVAGKDYYLEETPCHSDTAPYPFTYELCLKDPSLLTFSDELRVDFIYETYVSLSDPMYSVTVDRPCRSFYCHFNMNHPDYDLQVKSYGFMSFGNSSRKHLFRTQDGIMVRFRSWIFPGDGVVAALAAKDSHHESAALYTLPNPDSLHSECVASNFEQREGQAELTGTVSCI